MKKTLFIMLFSIVLIFTACQNNNINPIMENSNVKGFSTFSDKDNHSNIKVSIEGIEVGGYSPINTISELSFALTDENGSFDVSNIPSGNYILKAFYEGYYPNKTFITIEGSDMTLEKPLILYPLGDNGELEGYAKFIDKTVHSNILIEIRTLEGEPLPGMYTFTNKDGYYYFDIVPVGDFVVSATYKNNDDYSGDAAPIKIMKNIKTKANDLILRNAAEHILIFKDVDAWSQSTAITNILDEMGFSQGLGENHYEVKNSDFIISTNSFDTSNVIIIEGDQTTAFYDNYKNNSSKFNDFVFNGGTIFWIACDNGWNSGNFTGTLPGGVTWRDTFDSYNIVTNPTHPLLYGFPNDRNISGSYASHGGFDNLNTANIENLVTFIKEITPTEKYPTYIEYRYGKGRVIASTSPLEYYAGQSGGDYYWYLLLMKRSIEYAFNMQLSPVALEINPPNEEF